MRIHAVSNPFLAVSICLLSGCSAPVQNQPEPRPARVVEEGPPSSLRQALKEGRSQEALTLAKQYARENPGDLDGILLQAEALAQLERYEEAMELVGQALRADTRALKPRLLKGRLYWIDGRFDEAAVEFRNVLEMDPNCLEGLTYLGLVLIQAGQYAQAVEILEQALSFSPNDIQVLNNLGVACAATGNLKRARDLYQTAVVLTPGDPKLRNNLADVLLRLGQASEAAVHIDELVRLSPDRSNALRLQRDLVTVGVVVDAVCRKEKAVITRVEAAFEQRGWSREEAADSLRRVTGDPLFDAMVREAVQHCLAP